MVYNLGTVGLGHWVKRLYEVLKQYKEINLVKTIGTRAFDDKKEELEKYGISEDRYFRINPGDPLPEKFFEDLDIVYIASPNQFHKSQTIQSLENGKVTVTEKTFATNKEDFYEILKFIRDNRFENKVTIHLHYLSKALTNELRKRLPEFIEKYGKITRISATFFEKTNSEDARRTWLFKPENGGIFLDWIHPIEITSHVLRADSFKLVDARTFVVQPLYDTVNPSAVECRFILKGENFKDSEIVVRVGKGFELEHKKFRIKFEDAVVDLNYLSTEEEISTGRRGEMEIFNDGHQTVVPQGPLSYEVMIQEMLRMIKGTPPNLSLEEIKKFYGPIWDFQKFTEDLQPTKDKEEIKKFVEDSLLDKD
ncbi:MAG: Gfo/Idh/MocA family oxidoreductase [Candidatus Aenigmatarchaeota archaeon]|nr:Gfo/Idh/MocA family oxidoreductase [Candidatus Aenigmarchaeota archaeon]